MRKERRANADLAAFRLERARTPHAAHADVPTFGSGAVRVSGDRLFASMRKRMEFRQKSLFYSKALLDKSLRNGIFSVRQKSEVRKRNATKEKGIDERIPDDNHSTLDLS